MGVIKKYGIEYGGSSQSQNAGHTIQDSSGSDMTARGTLQFAGVPVTDDSANDKTIVQVSKELTRAQYEALSQTEKNNGTMYFITDEPEQPAHVKDIYTTSEVIIGTWVDGKQIYQKTIVDTMPSSTSAIKGISVGAQIETVVDVNTLFIKQSSHAWMKITDVADTLDNFARVYVYDYQHGTYPNQIRIKATSDTWINCPCHITIKYTKASV